MRTFIIIWTIVFIINLFGYIIDMTNPNFIKNESESLKIFNIIMSTIFVVWALIVLNH